jgi:outer membrane protein assembly factor BamB
VIRRSLVLACVALLAAACPGPSASKPTAGPLSATASPTPVTAPGIDWSSFGFDARRSGLNPNEARLTADTVAGLRELWRYDLGGPTVTAPVVAAGVDVAGTLKDLVVVGTEAGEVFALDSVDGRLVWKRRVGSVATDCQEFPGGVHGVSGSPVLERSANRVYVAGGSGKVFALDLATGSVEDGWPVTITTEPKKDHVYGALALWNGLLYAETAGICEPVPFQGKLFAIDVHAASIVATFYPTGQDGPSGGGMWGSGGVSIDPSNGDVFVATGNARTHPEDYGYSESVVRLSPKLAVKASNAPGVAGIDSDFGATPLLYRAPGCRTQLAVENKDGELFVYERAAIGDGPVQRLQIADAGVEQFQGSPAYSPDTNLVYVVNPSDSIDGSFRHGLVALSVRPDCTLGLAWQTEAGPNRSIGSPPTVAGGVVYFADGFGRKVFALDARTGEQLWDSGSTIAGAVYTAPVVVNGLLYVGSWNHTFYAFGL